MSLFGSGKIPYEGDQTISGFIGLFFRTPSSESRQPPLSGRLLDSYLNYVDSNED